MRFVETPRKFVFAKLDGERNLSLWIKNFAIINLCMVLIFTNLLLRSLHVVILPIQVVRILDVILFFVQLLYIFLTL